MLAEEFFLYWCLFSLNADFSGAEFSFQAIHMETDPQTISAYLVYLSQHAPVEEQGQHNDLALVSGWVARAEGLRGGDSACLGIAVGMGLAVLAGRDFLGACKADNCMFVLEGSLCLWFRTMN